VYVSCEDRRPSPQDEKIVGESNYVLLALSEVRMNRLSYNLCSNGSPTAA
jgi:hypothetical protein